VSDHEPRVGDVVWHVTAQAAPRLCVVRVCEDGSEDIRLGTIRESGPSWPARRVDVRLAGILSPGGEIVHWNVNHG